MKKFTILPPDVETPAALSRDSEMDLLSRGLRYKVKTNFPQVELSYFETYKEALAFYKEKTDRVIN